MPWSERIEHGGDPVKAEAVKMKPGEPVFQIGQKEVQHLIFPVVKALGLPRGMIPPRAFMEELMVRAVKLVDALPGVPAGVGMDHVQQYRNAHFVSSINEFFQFIRRAEPGGGGEEIGHLIAERGIIGVLHHRHDLNGVIA